MRLPAAEATIEAHTTHFASRDIFLNLFDLETPRTLRCRGVRPPISENSLSLSSEEPLRVACFCSRARSCSSTAHSGSKYNDRKSGPANQGRVFSHARHDSRTKGRSLATRIHRIRDADDFASHLRYIHQNPVVSRIVSDPREYRYSSAFPGFKLDPWPSAAEAAA